MLAFVRDTALEETQQLSIDALHHRCHYFTPGAPPWRQVLMALVDQLYHGSATAATAAATDATAAARNGGASLPATSLIWQHVVQQYGSVPHPEGTHPQVGGWGEDCMPCIKVQRQRLVGRLLLTAPRGDAPAGGWGGLCMVHPEGTHPQVGGGAWYEGTWVARGLHAVCQGTQKQVGGKLLRAVCRWHAP